jgi:phage tail-like protein
MPTASRKDPYENFNFLVEIDGIVQAGFTKVLIPEAMVDVIEYREGADPTLSARKIPGRVHFGNVVLKWGASASNELYKWWKKIQDGATDRRNMSIVLLDRSRSPVKRWNVQNAFPMAYRVAPLDAGGREVLIERLEVANEGVELTQ